MLQLLQLLAVAIRAENLLLQALALTLVHGEEKVLQQEVVGNHILENALLRITKRLNELWCLLDHFDHLSIVMLHIVKQLAVVVLWNQDVFLFKHFKCVWLSV
jgi:hypothetical protein